MNLNLSLPLVFEDERRSAATRYFSMEIRLAQLIVFELIRGHFSKLFINLCLSKFSGF